MVPAFMRIVVQILPIKLYWMLSVNRMALVDFNS